MNIIFRVDSGSIIGMGHVMRCLNLARCINNANISFICKKHSGNIIHLIKKYFKVHELDINKNVTYDTNTWLGSDWSDDVEQTNNYMINIDMIIIDHYAIDEQWERIINAKKIIVIDDIFNRKHYCDVLINQNMIGQNLYLELTNNCKYLFGLEYIILNSYFIKEIPKEINEIKRVHICMGSDTYNLTEKILETLINNFNFEYDVVSNRDIKYDNVNIYNNIDNMAQLINKADVCIGSCGTSTYERIYLGKPSITYTIADNQLYIAKTQEKLGTIKYMGHYNEFNPKNLIEQMDYWIDNIDKIRDISKNNIKLIDNNGCSRIIKTIMN